MRDGKGKFYRNLNLPKDLRRIVRAFREIKYYMLKEGDRHKPNSDK